MDELQARPHQVPDAVFVSLRHEFEAATESKLDCQTRPLDVKGVSHTPYRP